MLLLTYNIRSKPKREAGFFSELTDSLIATMAKTMACIIFICNVIQKTARTNIKKMPESIDISC
jgi:hypothetical protein